MAFGTPTDGGAAYSAQNGTSVSPAYPTGIVAGDVLVLIVGMKPSTANGGTIGSSGAITGWTQREAITAQGGYGTTLGADEGNTNLWIYTKDTVSGSESGNLSVTIGTNNVAWGLIVRVPTNGGTITYGTADGSRATAPTSGTAFTNTLTNGTTAPNFEADDMAIWAMCIPTDVLNNGFTVPTISSSGTTFGTAVELEEPDSGTGNDIGGYVAYAEATSGSSTAAPTVGATATGTVTNVRGPIALIRIRETLAERTGSLDATETGSDTFTSSGDVIVQGSLSASETGSDTFTASGSVTDPTITGSFAATETESDTFSSSGNVIITGSLSVSETGSDTFTSSGTVLVSGTADVTETGSDTFTASGSLTSVSSGSLDATETGDDTLSSSGQVLVQGSLVVTELGEDTFTAAGQVLITGLFSTLETGDDSFSGEGTALGGVVGSVSAVESGSDILGGYVDSGYVDNGYVNPGISGFLGRIGALNATESTGAGGDLPYVLKYFNGTTWQILYKDPTVYT